MFDIVTTIVLYNAVFLIAFILCSKAEKMKKRNYVFWAYFLVTALSALRYDIGADYDGYARVIESIVNDFHQNGLNIFVLYMGLKGMEPAIVLMSIFFSFTSEPLAWVVAAYSVLMMVLVYYALDKYSAHKWGLFLFFITSLMFSVWDTMRQGLAIAILLNCLPLIKERRIIKFACTVIIATLVHYSSFLFAIVYIFAYFQVSRKIAISICLFFFGLAEVGVLSSLNGFFVSIAPYFSDFYSVDSLNTTYTYTDLSYIFNALWLTFLIYLLPREENILANIIMVGALLHIIAGGILHVDRIGYYFSAYQLIALPLVLKYKRLEWKKIAIAACVFALFSLNNIRILAQTYKGCSPYETIFSSEFQRKQFRDDY